MTIQICLICQTPSFPSILFGDFPILYLHSIASCVRMSHPHTGGRLRVIYSKWIKKEKTEKKWYKIYYWHCTFLTSEFGIAKHAQIFHQPIPLFQSTTEHWQSWRVGFFGEKKSRGMGRNKFQQFVPMRTDTMCSCYCRFLLLLLLSLRYEINICRVHIYAYGWLIDANNQNCTLILKATAEVLFICSELLR